MQRNKRTFRPTMTVHRQATAMASAAAAHRRLLTKILLLVVVSTTLNFYYAAASSPPSNDTAPDAECNANTNDKNADEAQICASRIVPPSNGDVAVDESNAEVSSTVNSGACEDMHADCAERADRGDCGGKFAGFMLDECQLSCHVCGDYEYVVSRKVPSILSLLAYLT